MFIGHYSISLLVKTAEKRLPLWLLFVSVQLVDILWGIFILLGIEHYRISPGITASLPFDLYYMPYTHSLVATVGWAVLVFVGYRWLAGTGEGNRPAFFLALASLSHWFLDFIVHRPDLPLYDDALKVGLGLWNYPMTALSLESGLFAGALWFFLRFDRGASRRARIGMVLFGLVIFAIHCVLLWGPLPMSTKAGAVNLFVIYLALAAIAFWLERKKAGAVTNPGQGER